MYFKQIKFIGVILAFGMMLGISTSSVASNSVHIGNTETWEIQPPPWLTIATHPVPPLPPNPSLPTGLSPVQKSAIVKIIATHQRHINALLRLISKNQQDCGRVDESNQAATMDAFIEANVLLDSEKNRLAQCVSSLVNCRRNATVCNETTKLKPSWCGFPSIVCVSSSHYNKGQQQPKCKIEAPTPVPRGLPPLDLESSSQGSE